MLGWVHYYTTKPSQNYRSMFPLTFDLSETGSFWCCFHLDIRKKRTRQDATEKILQRHVSKIKKPPEQI